MNKYNYLYVLQGNYGYGWDDLTATDKSDPNARKEIRADYKAYIENDRTGTFRIISRRELNNVKVIETGGSLLECDNCGYKFAKMSFGGNISCDNCGYCE